MLEESRCLIRYHVAHDPPLLLFLSSPLHAEPCCDVDVLRPLLSASLPPGRNYRPGRLPSLHYTCTYTNTLEIETCAHSPTLLFCFLHIYKYIYMFTCYTVAFIFLTASLNVSFPKIQLFGVFAIHLDVVRAASSVTFTLFETEGAVYPNFVEAIFLQLGIH